MQRDQSRRVDTRCLPNLSAADVPKVELWQDFDRSLMGNSGIVTKQIERDLF